MKTVSQRYALFFYFALAYGIAWGGSLLIAATKGFDPASIGLSEIFIMFLFMLAGPSLAGVGLTAVLEGRSGLKALLSRLKEWRFGWRWGAVAVLTVPVLSLATLLLLSALVSPVYRPEITPDKLLFGLIAGSLAGFFEEIGWSGFALPRLRSRYSPLASGLILGVLWSVWHIVADYWGNTAAFDLYWLPTFILFWFMPLVAYRTLMVWVYQNRPNLPLMQLMHAFYSGTLGVVGPTTSVAEGLLWKALFATVMWVALTVVVIRYGGDLSRQNLKNAQ
jgi:uncharacterized protein